MTHTDLVALWRLCEDVFLAVFVFSAILALSPLPKCSGIGFILLFTTWLVWVVAFRIADDYRNVNNPQWVVENQE